MSDQKTARDGETPRREAPAGEGDGSSGDELKSSNPLPPEARDVIGEKLRSLYGSLVAVPLPERFTRLLDELAAKERNGDAPRDTEDQS